MKEKIKEYLLVISIFYGIVIIALMTMTYTKMENYIEVKAPDNFYTDLSKYKTEVTKVKNESCKQEIGNLINFIESHTLNGKVNLKDYYAQLLNGEAIAEYYSNTKTACSISDVTATDKGLEHMFLAATMQNDEIYQKYLYQHELSIKDVNYRMIAEPSMINNENNLSKLILYKL